MSKNVTNLVKDIFVNSSSVKSKQHKLKEYCTNIVIKLLKTRDEENVLRQQSHLGDLPREMNTCSFKNLHPSVYGSFINN
jgi:chromosome condensin MukBEF complex kleisin-like MukF subunit